MITICCAIWGPNALSSIYSRHYTESDVEKLYRGFRRNLSGQMRFICWSDRGRVYAHPEIEQRELLPVGPNGICYRSLTQLYALGEPMILAGLDTVVVGNCDPLAAYCLSAAKPASPIDPFMPETVCNGVVFVPGGHAWMWHDSPRQNDMDWIRDLYRMKKLDALDALFPGAVVSYKGQVMHEGLKPETRIVYFHGDKKPHQLGYVGWIRKHWA